MNGSDSILQAQRAHQGMPLDDTSLLQSVTVHAAGRFTQWRVRREPGKWSIRELVKAEAGVCHATVRNSLGEVHIMDSMACLDSNGRGGLNRQG